MGKGGEEIWIEVDCGKRFTSQMNDTFDSGRREFMRKMGGAGAAVAMGGIPIFGEAAKKVSAATSETLVATFYGTLSDEQKEAFCFPFDHELRSKVDNNWHITKTAVSALTADQQAMVREIFNGLHSEEYAEKVMAQVIHDSGKAGWESGAVAVFGEPGTGQVRVCLHRAALHAAVRRGFGGGGGIRRADLLRPRGGWV